MSPRHNASSQKEKRSEGEKFADALGLGDNPEVFEEYKIHFRRLAVETFNLNLPLFQQTQNMTEFTEKVLKAFPGVFNSEFENNTDRINRLQHYARSYLDKSGKMSASRSKAQGKAPKPRSSKFSEATAPPSPPKKLDNVIKASRPPTPKLKSAMKTTAVIDEHMPDAPPLVNSRPPSRQGVHSRSRKTSLIDQPMPDAPPLANVTSTPNRLKHHSAPTTTPATLACRPTHNHAAPPSAKQAASRPTTATEPSALAAVLARFFPPMDHCAPAFERAGFTSAAELAALQFWDDARLRAFLTVRNDIARTPLEEEALIMGLHTLPI